MEDGKYDVFISYSRKDYDCVSAFKREVEEKTSARCWMDLEGIESGNQKFTKAIIDAINACPIFLFMLSEASQQSENALKELDFAYEKYREVGKRVVIVYIQPCKMTDEFRFDYGKADTIDWKTKLQHDKLIRDLRRWTSYKEKEEAKRSVAEEECRRKDEEVRSKSELQRIADEEVQKQPVQSSLSAPQKKKKLLLYLLAALVVFVVAVVAIVISLSKGGDTQQEVDVPVAEAATVTQSDDNLILKVGNVAYTMVYVEGGSFIMGATKEQGSDAEDDEEPAHTVSLSDYFIGDAEVTQALWQAVMGSNPSFFTGDSNRPVESVSWVDCQEFISRLNSMTGLHFRLPTEAEWEYAARGGNKSRGYKYSGSNDVGSVAWYEVNSDDETHPVKTKSPNELDIYDMSGNVCEWCQDWYDSYSSGSQTNPTGASSGALRVDRGGSGDGGARFCRSSNRGRLTPSDRYYYLGFRLAL